VRIEANLISKSYRQILDLKIFDLLYFCGIFAVYLITELRAVAAQRIMVEVVLTSMGEGDT
jgi:hypothetical protein